jgi:hypothetical protein
VKILCLAAAFVLVGLLSTNGVLLAKEKDTQKKVVPSRVCGQKLDINLSVGGRIRGDYFFFNKPATFRGDLDDQFSYFILKNCDAPLKGDVFFSGQFYKNLQRQPNKFCHTRID